MLKILLLAVLFVIPVASQAETNHEDIAAMFSHYLQQPEGPQRIKSMLSEWSPEGRKLFSDKFAKQISDTYLPHLPMTVDADTTLVSIGTLTEKLIFTYTLSDDSLKGGDLFQDLRPLVLNGVCSTPVSAMLLLLNYTVNFVYYDKSMSYQNQFLFNESDCWTV